MNLKAYTRELRMREAEKLAKTAFVTVCMDCGDILSIMHKVKERGVSHGLCPKCFAIRMNKELKPGDGGAHQATREGGSK